MPDRDDGELVARLRELAASPEERTARVAAAARMVRAARGYRWVGIYDVGAADVRNVAFDGPGPPAHPVFARTRGLTSRAIASGAPVVVNDVAADPDYLTALGSTRSEAIFPVLLDGAVVGTLDVESAAVDAFSADDVALLARCADALRGLFERPAREPGT